MAVTKNTKKKESLKGSRRTKVVNNGDLNEIRHYKKTEVLDYKKIGERLVKVRNNTGLYISDMAKTLNISVAALSKIERGELSISGNSLIILHETFGVDIEWLLFGTTSTADKVCSVLYSMPNSDIIDIFLGIQSYLVTGDKGMLNARTNEVVMPDISTNENGKYRFLTHKDLPTDYVPFINKPINEIDTQNLSKKASSLNENEVVIALKDAKANEKALIDKISALDEDKLRSLMAFLSNMEKDN